MTSDPDLGEPLPGTAHIRIYAVKNTGGGSFRLQCLGCRVWLHERRENQAGAYRPEDLAAGRSFVRQHRECTPCQ